MYHNVSHIEMRYTCMVSPWLSYGPWTYYTYIINLCFLMRLYHRLWYSHGSLKEMYHKYILAIWFCILRLWFSHAIVRCTFVMFIVLTETLNSYHTKCVWYSYENISYDKLPNSNFGLQCDKH